MQRRIRTFFPAEKQRKSAPARQPPLRRRVPAPRSIRRRARFLGVPAASKPRRGGTIPKTPSVSPGTTRPKKCPEPRRGDTIRRRPPRPRGMIVTLLRSSPPPSASLSPCSRMGFLGCDAPPALAHRAAQNAGAHPPARPCAARWRRTRIRTRALFLGVPAASKPRRGGTIGLRPRILA